ncbi:MAG: Smr/MutS family protein [Gammaproteobacteria bacterium]
MAKKFPSAEDSDLFRQSVGLVSPVVNDKAILQSRPKPKPYPRKHAPEVAQRLDSRITHSSENLSVEDRMLYCASGLQKTVLKKLRSGYFGLDAELDLHGLNSDQAKHCLLHFVHRCVEEGLRCIHIIHGKGYRSPDMQPVLKNDLNLWLRQHRDVLAFCSAPRRDGGAGAVYVLLRLAEKFGDDEIE